MKSASLQIGSGTRNNVVAPIDSNFVNVGQKYANSQFQVVPGAAALDHEDTDMPEMSRKQYLDLKDGKHSSVKHLKAIYIFVFCCYSICTFF